MPASYEKIDYAMRPSKQVERKLFVETLHRLAQLGYPLSTYAYLGFGSVYYVDFVLFHKYLLIDRMDCVEQTNIPRRMRFNKPFPCVRLWMSPVSDVLPRISRNRPYIVWLDYDYGPNAQVLRDIGGCLQVLCPGSILIATVDAERRLADRTKVPEDADDSDLRSYYSEELGRHLPGELQAADVQRHALPRLFATVLRSQIQESMIARPELRFHQLFNFQYNDGCQMLTIGGLIDRPEARRKLHEAGVLQLEHVRTGAIPLTISVPPLTAREKQWLDRYLVRAERGERIPFEMQREHLRNYRRFYRHYPVFHEALL